MNTYTRNRFARSTVFENNCSKNHRVMEESRFTRGRGGRLAFENLFSGGENVIPRYKRSDKLKVSADTQYLKNTSKVQYYHPKGINMSYDNPSPVWGDYPQRRRRNQQPTFQQQRQQGIDVSVTDLDRKSHRRTITPSTTIEVLASGFRESSQDVYFVHCGNVLTDLSLQRVARGSTIEMKRAQEAVLCCCLLLGYCTGFDAWLRQLDGTYICIKITPSLTTRELANWFRVSPQKVGFHHQGATLTNQIFQQVKKAGERK
ncbi:uncharacterized protein LOC135684316 isoform X2 [Rhopilema esculentum]|uniref:uncharacterized protein LOC135684316 isoform X2 n=1 Tax=Rhopilema esculentum TaxID=499914 RepID=UPI0031CDBF3B